MQADGVFLQAACTLSIDEKEKHRGQCGAELGVQIRWASPTGAVVKGGKAIDVRVYGLPRRVYSDINL